VLAARSAERLARVRRECADAGADALDVVTDVSVEADCRRLMERAVATFGDIDILVANAGVSMHARFDLIEDFSTFERLFRINAMGTVWCVRHAYASLRRTRGLVVGVSSLAGKTGVPGRTTYCTSKFAQSGFLEAFRIEAEEHGVAVMAAFPGVVQTEIRRHGWNGRGEPAGVSGLAEDDAMPVEQCARLIVDGMRRRRRDVVMTARARFGLWLKLIAPARVDALARAALARHHEQQSN
jgi:NAD(P)-dependent dehydrogenase (short-subunit alcohol dehydrogenase family)